MLSSYRNQKIDLLYKSVRWFLYDVNIGRWRIKAINELKNYT